MFYLSVFDLFLHIFLWFVALQSRYSDHFATHLSINLEDKVFNNSKMNKEPWSLKSLMRCCVSPGMVSCRLVVVEGQFSIFMFKTIKQKKNKKSNKLIIVLEREFSIT